LRDEVFGNHWQDEIWHEVLRLICGAIDAKFAGQLIEFLMTRECDLTQFLDEEWLRFTGQKRLTPEGISYLLLAADCFLDVGNAVAILNVQNLLLRRLQLEIEQPRIQLTRTTASETINRIAQYFKSNGIMSWLIQRTQQNESSVVQSAAVVAIAKYYRDDSTTLRWLKENVQQGADWGVRQGALESIIEHYHNDPDVLMILKQRVQEDKDWGVRSTAIDALSKYFPNESRIFEFLWDVVQNDSFTRNVAWEDNPRQASLKALLTHYSIHPKTLELLRDRASNDPDKQLRQWAQEQLKMQNVKQEMEESSDG